MAKVEIKQKQYENILNYSKHQVDSIYPEEIADPEQYREGATKIISVNIYERNLQARAKCLEYHGYSCMVCSFDFEQKYGKIGREFIHVHHLQQLADIGKEYQLDPVHDLRPVCPNCHAMIHRRRPPYSIEELRNILEIQLTSTSSRPQKSPLVPRSAFCAG